MAVVYRSAKDSAARLALVFYWGALNAESDLKRYRRLWLHWALNQTKQAGVHRRQKEGDVNTFTLSTT